MTKDILVETERGQTRVAVLEDHQLAELYVERKGREKLVGGIYKGRVANILPGMQAAFVDIGLDKNAFLYAGDIRVDTKDFGGDAAAVEQQLTGIPIQKMLRPGQEILVQVVKEPGGTKGPRISSHVTLPGRMAVLLPTVGYVGVSRRIEDEEERARLRQLAESLRPEGMGLIVRTAAAGAEKGDFEGDIEYLTRLWRSIERRGAVSSAPALLHRDESVVYRAVRDLFTEEVDAMVLDDPEQFQLARETAQMLSPAISCRVSLHNGPQPLFDLYRVDEQAGKALSRKVWLKSGGYLVIDYTEALTVIDVNTGKFVGSKTLSDTVFAINCEAVYEIARQLRLRDLGGIIVIDFIDMELTEHREQLVTLLRQQLKRDRTKTNVVGLTGLGLVEMTRKKVHQPVHTLLTRTCPHCHGTGMMVSEETVARSILRELKGRAARGESQAFLVEAASEVCRQLTQLGGVRGARAYVKEVPGGIQEHRISPVAEHELPPKTRLLTDPE